MYFLSGGPTWTMKDCAAMNLSTTTATKDEINHRPPLTLTEEMLLNTSYSDIVTNMVSILENMDFLKDHNSNIHSNIHSNSNSNSNLVHERYHQFAPMAQVSIAISLLFIVYCIIIVFDDCCLFYRVPIVLQITNVMVHIMILML